MNAAGRDAAVVLGIGMRESGGERCKANPSAGRGLIVLSRHRQVIERSVMGVARNILFGGMNDFGKEQATAPELGEYVAAALRALRQRRAQWRGRKNGRG